MKPQTEEPAPLCIRAARREDTAALASLFTRSVHELARAAYSPAQCAAWAPQPPRLTEWEERLQRLQIHIAELDQTAAGFIGVTPGGYLDLLFVAPHYVRRGVATALCDGVEAQWRTLGVDIAHTESSLYAQPFFAGRGYATVAVQDATRHGVVLRRFAMRKSLRA